jgi:hypothetical protein
VEGRSEPPPLGPDHVCRRDDPGYDSVGAWYEAHRGRVPNLAAMARDGLVRDRGLTFAEAFRAQVDRGAFILLDYYDG